MARTRTLADMATDARRLADLENATARFPDAEVYEYVNKGLTHVYRALVTVSDRPYYQKDHKFQTVGGQSVYPLKVDFLRIMSVQWATSTSGPWSPLDPYEEAERSMYINSGFFGAQWPIVYGITGGDGAYTQGSIPTAYAIEILPQPPANSTVWIRYIPTPQRLTQPTDTFDGILGFEDAACTWAAVLMRRKDDLTTDDLERDMARHMADVRSIGHRRDGRPPKVSLTRNRFHLRGPFRGRAR